MSEKERVLTILSAMKPKLVDDFYVRSLALFGSMARDESTLQSDVDILVDFVEVPDLFRFIELEEQLKNALGKEVDLVPQRKLKNALRDQIMQEAITV